jgi:hypothetical protein
MVKSMDCRYGILLNHWNVAPVPSDWRAIVFQQSTAKFPAPFTQYEISIYGLYMRAYERLVVPLYLWEISVAHQCLECKPPPLEKKEGHSFIADVIYDSVVE